MLRLIPLYLISLLLSSVGYSAPRWKLLDTEELSLEYHKLNPNNRDPYAPQYTGKWRERIALNWDSTIVGYRGYRLMWNHHIHTETIDSGAVKTVGWQWKAGFELGKHLEIYHNHHSKHIMDERVDNPAYNGKTNQFPVEDSFVVTVKFINKGK